MRSFDTLVQALNALKEEGYTYDFNLLEDGLYCRQLKEKFRPEAFNVDEVFRFEGESNPDDNSVLYAITTDGKRKGTLLDAYGPYSGEIAPELLEKLKMP